jgi:hypothetical protein
MTSSGSRLTRRSASASSVILERNILRLQIGNPTLSG